MQFRKPEVKRLDDGRYACNYQNENGVTSLTAGSYEELIEKLAVSHQNSVAALKRTRDYVDRVKTETYDQKTREADAALQSAKQDMAVWAWMRQESRYVPNQANANILLSWIQSQGLEVTPQNLQISFDLNFDRLTHAAPTPAVQPPAPPAPEPVAQPSAPVENLPTKAELVAMSPEEFRFACRKFGDEVVVNIYAEGRR